MRTLGLRTVWDMLKIHSGTFAALGYLSGVAADWRLWVQILQHGQAAPPVLSLEMRAQVINSCMILKETASALEMHAAEAASQRAIERCGDQLAWAGGYDAYRLSEVSELLRQLLQVFGDDLQRQWIIGLKTSELKHFKAESVFGDAVEDAFPTASYDIAEASKCRALERWTACVMHLMRVQEVGLAALARFHCLPVDKNWNTLLNQIEAKTRETTKRTHGDETEQWAAEAATHLRFVKNAWRNHAAHALSTYDEERAVAIFESTRSFMQHLATKLTDDGPTD
jgi:hypothetical protein